MKLIVGLGNPGEEYENTRHNAGRNAVRAIQRTADLPQFAENKKFFSLISGGSIGKNKVIVALPETMMNGSGKAVRAIVEMYKIKPADIMVVHDDADILFGAMKISFAKRAAGHRGVESVRRALKTDAFWRLRIGIQPSAKKHIPAMDLVLKKFSPKDSTMMKKLGKRAAAGIAVFIEQGGEAAMTEFN